MDILTYDEYKTYNTGVEISESEYSTLYFYAETAFLAFTGRKTLPNDEQIKRAMAFQISYSQLNGGIDYYNDISYSSGSESLGKYSYSSSVGTNQNKSQSSYGVFPIIARILRGYCITSDIVPVEVKL